MALSDMTAVTTIVLSGTTTFSTLMLSNTTTIATLHVVMHDGDLNTGVVSTDNARDVGVDGLVAFSRGNLCAAAQLQIV